MIYQNMHGSVAKHSGVSNQRAGVITVRCLNHDLFLIFFRFRDFTIFIHPTCLIQNGIRSSGIMTRASPPYPHDQPKRRDRQ